MDKTTYTSVLLIQLTKRKFKYTIECVENTNKMQYRQGLGEKFCGWARDPRQSIVYRAKISVSH